MTTHPVGADIRTVCVRIPLDALPDVYRASSFRLKAGGEDVFEPFPLALETCVVQTADVCGEEERRVHLVARDYMRVTDCGYANRYAVDAMLMRALMEGGNFSDAVWDVFGKEIQATIAAGRSVNLAEVQYDATYVEHDHDEDGDFVVVGCEMQKVVAAFSMDASEYRGVSLRFRSVADGKVLGHIAVAIAPCGRRLIIHSGKRIVLRLPERIEG